MKQWLVITIFLLVCQLDFMHAQSNLELIVFEGSDWCASCRKFENTILNDTVFLNYITTKKIKLKIIDFPQRKILSKEQDKTNKYYAEKYSFQGVFPTIILSRTDTLRYKSLTPNKLSTNKFIQDLEKATYHLQ